MQNFKHFFKNLGNWVIVIDIGNLVINLRSIKAPRRCDSYIHSSYINYHKSQMTH